jgi:hypothetical protein
MSGTETVISRAPCACGPGFSRRAQALAGGAGAGCEQRPASRRLAFARVAVQAQDQRALRHLVAELHVDRAYDSGFRRRDLHRRLVRFQRDQRLLFLDGIARLDQYFDHSTSLKSPMSGTRTSIMALVFPGKPAAG